MIFLFFRFILLLLFFDSAVVGRAWPYADPGDSLFILAVFNFIFKLHHHFGSHNESIV